MSKKIWIVETEKKKYRIVSEYYSIKVDRHTMKNYHREKNKVYEHTMYQNENDELEHNYTLLGKVVYESDIYEEVALKYCGLIRRLKDD